MKTPEPFNIFSRRVDPRGVVAACRRVASDVRIDGSEDDWREILALGPKRFLRDRAKLRILRDPGLYDGPQWPNFVSGLVNYVGSFDAVPRQAEILRAAASIQFALAFPDADLDIESDDPRVAWVREICRQLDGFVFTPSMLLDANGKLLVSVDGRFDPAAVLPATPDNSGNETYDDAAENEYGVPPPTANRVARRAIALAAVANRGLTEHERAQHQHPEESRQALLDWLQAAGVSDEVEPDEWDVLQRPVGRLDAQSTIDAVWRFEGLGVLLWALGRYELPPYDQVVTPAELFERVAIFDAEAGRRFVEAAQLRSSNELDAYRNHATMANWRFRNYRLHPGPMDFVAFSRDCWIGTFDITQFRISGNDVMVGERSIVNANSELLGMCESIANERHRAINWLCGDSRIYSETDTST